MTRRPDVATDTPAFLARAAAELEVGGWIFTGFNWPVLAARVARRRGTDFVQVLEAGAALHSDTDELLTSTTDYFVTDPVTCYRGGLTDIVYSIVPRCSRVFIDAANVDVGGRTNSSSIGERSAPKVRLPGGGGGPDVAATARHLVLLHGGENVERIVGAVHPITAAPSPGAEITLVTRWGRVRLGAEPRLLSAVDSPAADDFIRHLATLGVDVTSPSPDPTPSAIDLDHARAVIVEARSRGYSISAPKT